MLSHFVNGPNRQEAGYVLVTSSLSILVLLGFVGLAVDVGYLQFQKRRIQSAADAAAAGAAFQLAAHATADTARTEAKYDSKKNGFEDGTNGVTITVNIPPTGGNYTASSYAAEAIVRQNTPTFFMQLFSISNATVAARAVGQVGNSTGCIYALDPTAQDAFLESGGGTHVSIPCGVNVNSSNSKALETSGGSCLGASSVNVVGDQRGAQWLACAGGAAPNTLQPHFADPLAFVPDPTVPAGCDHTNYTAPGGTSTIAAGTYCNGITVSGGGTTLHLGGGMYYLKGGGMTVSGGANLISDGGVTFYNTQAPGFSYSKLSVTGGSTTTLNAPTTGDYAGILFFQDRSIVDNNANVISGTSTTNFTGALYFKTTPLEFSGGSSGAGDWTIIVADKVKFTGGSNLGNDFSSYPNGSPIKQGAKIVE